VSARPLKIGLLLPDSEGYMNGETAHWPDLRALAETAETVGFDSIWVTDHFLHRENGVEIGPWECWSLLSALAATTRRVEIGTLVLCTGFRNPAHLAKMADTVEDISDGRLILGIGAGWNEAEYDAFGYPFDHRVDRFEESLNILAPLLRTGGVTFDGAYSFAHDAVLRPRGPRPSGPPVMIGTSGAGPRMLRLTARFADQWNVWFNTFDNDLDTLIELNRTLDAICLEEGRDPATLERTAAIKVEIASHSGSPMGTEPITGTSQEIADVLRAYGQAGISHVQIWLDPNTVDGVRAFADVLRLLDGAPA
jgi:alkanesulfonate monooxygenase SsuD/methylene tetrahydromethanopterin reductase-like flavin-dependent oxidoreductase (luciferase family)